jgi:hypothetical protein
MLVKKGAASRAEPVFTRNHVVGYKSCCWCGAWHRRIRTHWVYHLVTTTTRGISYERESKSETDSRRRLESAVTDHSGSLSKNGINQLARLGPTNQETSLSAFATQTRKSPVGFGVGD